MVFKGKLAYVYKSFKIYIPNTSDGEGNGSPLQYSCLENPMDGGAWWDAVHGVAQSWIRLKRLSSSSSKARLDQVNIILKKSHTFINVCGLYTYS